MGIVKLNYEAYDDTPPPYIGSKVLADRFNEMFLCPKFAEDEPKALNDFIAGKNVLCVYNRKDDYQVVETWEPQYPAKKYLEGILK